MIQRIQTVYLALGAMVLVGALLLPNSLTAAVAERGAWLDVMRTVLSLAAGGAGVVAIFLYARRTVQARVALVAQVLALLALLSMAIGIYLGWAALPAVSVAGLAAAVAPALAYLLFALARAAIGRDIALVRSMDRLR